MPDEKQTPRPLIPEFKRIAAQEVVTQEDDPTFGGNFDDAYNEGHTAGEVSVVEYALPVLVAARDVLKEVAEHFEDTDAPLGAKARVVLGRLEKVGA